MKRYSLDIHWDGTHFISETLNPDGEWVLCEDAAKLEAENAELKRVIKHISKQGRLLLEHIGDYQSGCDDELSSEVIESFGELIKKLEKDDE